MIQQWPSQSLKRHLQRNDGGVWGEEPTGINDSLVLRSTEQSATGAWQIVDPALRSISIVEKRRSVLIFGDIVVTKSSGSASHIGKATIVDREVAAMAACYSNFMQRLRCGPDLRAKFLWYSLQSRSVRDQIELASTTSTGLANLTGSSIGDLQIKVPAGPVQDLVVRHLDRETAEIDAFIADQEELIALLTERRAATISHAVTKGLDQTAPMKDSGVEWLGAVPAHWSIGRVGFVYTLTLGKMVNANAPEGEPRPYLRAANIQERGVDISEVKVMPVTAAEAASLTLKAGDVVVVEGGAGYGRSDVLTRDLVGWSFQNHIIRVRPSRNQEPRYLDYTIKALRSKGHFEAISAYATIPNLSSEKLAKIEFPFLPLAEQVAISDYLDHEIAELDAAITDAREAVALSKERRSALISAAVTGKIDVRRSV